MPSKALHHHQQSAALVAGPWLRFGLMLPAWPCQVSLLLTYLNKTTHKSLLLRL